MIFPTKYHLRDNHYRIPFQIVILDVHLFYDPDTGWECATIFLHDRYPNHEEVFHIKSLLWGNVESVVQYLTPALNYSKFKYSISLWKSNKEKIVTPIDDINKKPITQQPLRELEREKSPDSPVQEKPEI